MKLANGICGIAAIAAVLITTAACSNDDDSAAITATSTVQGDAARSSIAATASAAMSSVRDTAQQTIQDAINAILSAAPITFDAGSSDLGSIDTATLKAVAIPLRGNDTAITIMTYAEDSNPDTAESLADARGANIAAALEAEGIDKSRITVQSDANPTDPEVRADEATISVTDD
ncbi:OmpA family protein [Nocardia sp. NPDC058633]|uniref:OmpA family protein n=1 Tax=Nocardia sp. NPDC058633 TaxID=3346568 RepID=UPI00366588CA